MPVMEVAQNNVSIVVSRPSVGQGVAFSWPINEEMCLFGADYRYHIT